MSEAKHTSGQWFVSTGTHEKLGQALAVSTKEGDEVDVICVVDQLPGSEESTANARRIVDCVNACEGIEDPKNVVPQLLRANERVLELEPLRIQRDELLEALQFIASESMSMHVSYTYMIEKLQDIASAAIAKATRENNG
jgi:hypothetical protein